MPTAKRVEAAAPIEEGSAEYIAYAAFTDAVKHHSATLKEMFHSDAQRLEAALAVSRAFAAFMEAAGTPFPDGLAGKAEKRRVERENGRLLEVIRSAHAMIHAVTVMEVINHYSPGTDEWEHETTVNLIEIALATLRGAIERAESL